MTFVQDISWRTRIRLTSNVIMSTKLLSEGVRDQHSRLKGKTGKEFLMKLVHYVCFRHVLFRLISPVHLDCGLTSANWIFLKIRAKLFLFAKIVCKQNYSRFPFHVQSSTNFLRRKTCSVLKKIF